MVSPSWKELLWDRSAALPLVVFAVFACGGLLQQLMQDIAALNRAPNLHGTVAAFSTASVILFSAQQAVLCLVRIPPIARAEGIWPRTAAIANAYCGLLLLLIPRQDVGPALGMAALSLSLIGTAGAIATLTWLGRSFAILPQARQLVTTGPYRYIRHPLYLMENIGFLGIALQFGMPWSLIVFLLSAILVWVRVGCEEEVLSKAFPSYDAYRRTTWRFVPHIY